MNFSDIQKLLAAANYYKGAIDGVLGARMARGIEIIERNQRMQYPANVDVRTWSAKRRAVAAGQAILNAWKFPAGLVDGYVGEATREAYRAWEHKALTGRAEKIHRTNNKAYTPATRAQLPRQKDCGTFYGTPGPKGTVRKHIVTVTLPFRLRIDWNLKQTTNKISVHRKCAASIKAALIEVRARYGLADMRRLGIDRYAGGYNPRKVRGSKTRWSMHAYGCAVDFYAAPNGMRVGCPQALFCKPEYKTFLDIMEKHGWLPAIRLWGKDAMHFQRARL